jgi:ABC-2 type transport system ATP-binding protein
MAAALEAGNLVKTYRDFTLGPVSFEVAPGEVVGMVGANGSGKTTTLNALLGTVRPTSGEGLVLGVDTSNEDVAATSVLREVGVVADAMPYPAFRVEDLAAIGRSAYPDWNQRVFEMELADARIDGKREVARLSRGMGMRLQLAFAFAHDPQILVLDEATAGLDPIARDEILDRLRLFMLGDDKTILMSSHITSDLELLADRVIGLDDGRVLFDEPIDTICDTFGCATVTDEQFDVLCRQGFLADGTRVLCGRANTRILLADRAGFAEAWPELEVGRIGLDEYLRFMMRGETL